MLYIVKALNIKRELVLLPGDVGDGCRDGDLGLGLSRSRTYRAELASIKFHLAFVVLPSNDHGHQRHTRVIKVVDGRLHLSSRRHFATRNAFLKKRQRWQTERDFAGKRATVQL